jgi:hypothetical protein
LAALAVGFAIVVGPFDGKGLEGVTLRWGRPGAMNERVSAGRFWRTRRQSTAARDFSLPLSRTIYGTAVKSWDDYPEYMTEALGDIEAFLGNLEQAKAWWGWCVEEARGTEQRDRCAEKLRGTA